jgi:hypothetical protein
MQLVGVERLHPEEVAGSMPAQASGSPLGDKLASRQATNSSEAW